MELTVSKFNERSALLTLICIVFVTFFCFHSVMICPPLRACRSQNTKTTSTPLTSSLPDHQVPRYYQNAAPKSFRGFDNTRGHKNGCFIVPNYIHFIRFSQPQFTFFDALCVLAALKHQKPEKLYIHTDVSNFTGKYWELLKQEPGFLDVLEIVKIDMPTRINGQLLNPKWTKYHAKDITCIHILMMYGGIYLDNNSYIVRQLDDLRRFEITLGWKKNGIAQKQAIIAHPRARLLQLWLKAYQEYNRKKRHYNAEVKLTKEILIHNKHLLHREEFFLSKSPFYLFKYFSPIWRTHYIFHISKNDKYIRDKWSQNMTQEKWNENNVHKHFIMFRDMVYDVWPYNPPKIPYF